MGNTAKNGIHHVELWTSNLAENISSWEWIFQILNFPAYQEWGEGKSWITPDGSYICLVESPTVTGHHDRRRAGMNHLALRVVGREVVDEIRENSATNGWQELYGERYPYAGGSDHYALYMENAEGFKLELVAI